MELLALNQIKAAEEFPVLPDGFGCPRSRVGLFGPRQPPPEAGAVQKVDTASRKRCNRLARCVPDAPAHQYADGLPALSCLEQYVQLAWTQLGVALAVSPDSGPRALALLSLHARHARYPVDVWIWLSPCVMRQQWLFLHRW